ncbi:MAG TPA: NUDIX domain-containing protein [Firmicutes bacterium]|nr:NUDIX domain-containing protein [Bacillota bacterium]
MKEKFIEKYGLSAQRVRHAQRTAAFMAELAPLWGVSSRKGFLAGLYHDIARDMKPDALLRFCREASLPLEPWEKQWPLLLHGKVGALIMEQERISGDQEILDAVSRHVTAPWPMSPLSRLLYVADKAEPGRGWNGADVLRKKTLYDPSEVFHEVLGRVIAWLAEKKAFIHPGSLATFNRLSGLHVPEPPGACPYCGRWRNRPSVVDGIVKNQKGEIVLIRRGRDPHKGDWALPGGFIDWGETAREAVVREVREETGLSVEPLSLVGVFDSPERDKGRGTVSLVYDCRLTEDGSCRAGDDADDCRWFSFSALPPLAFDHAAIITLFLKKQ